MPPKLTQEEIDKMANSSDSDIQSKKSIGYAEN